MGGGEPFKGGCGGGMTADMRRKRTNTTDRGGGWVGIDIGRRLGGDPPHHHKPPHDPTPPARSERPEQGPFRILIFRSHEINLSYEER